MSICPFVTLSNDRLRYESKNVMNILKSGKSLETKWDICTKFKGIYVLYP